MSIAIVDYGMGNVGSILNMLRKAGAKSAIASSPEQIKAAAKLILPGVGAFDTGMRSLAERGLIPLLSAKVLEERTPILGICLGVQLFTQGSEEGQLPGLGWLAAQTRRFAFGSEHGGLKVPHMGWNTVAPRPGEALFAGFDEPPRFYFVHSYHLVCADPADVAGTSEYGYRFTSAVGRDNIAGVQFHPEKSHKYGLRLLKNFAEMP